jgi:putative endonuclease
MMSKVQGNKAEEFAAAWLEGRGLRVMARNWHCRFGELDLVVREGATIVIVEVRQRSSSRYGGAAASIDWHKQRKLAATAQLYLSRHPSAPCRFDVVLMSDTEGRDIEWIRNAFTL